MTVRWDIAAVVVGLLAIFAQVISVSPVALRLFHRTVRKFLCLIYPKGGQCRRLAWNEIPEGLLHQCNPPALCPHNLPQPSHSRLTTNSWDETLGQVFTKAWDQLRRVPLDSKFLVEKPDGLPFGEEYIQMDIKSLKAYLMLTTDLCHTCETEDMISSLRIKMYGNLITLYLQPSKRASIPKNPSLTKWETQQFIEGYPPFYRQSFVTTCGITLGPTISGTDGIGRGSWVLAVGMSTCLGAICAVHNMQHIPQEKNGAFWKGTLVPTAFKMIRRTLGYIEEYEINHDQLVKRMDGTKIIAGSSSYWSSRAISCYELIISEEFSGLPWPLKAQQVESCPLFEGVIGNCPCKDSCIGCKPHAETCGRDQHKKKDPSKALNERECKAALELFDNYQLSDHNLEIIMPKLPQILQSLMLGMSEVEHYFSYLGRKLELPRELADQKFVYLRKCAGEVD